MEIAKPIFPQGRRGLWIPLSLFILFCPKIASAQPYTHLVMEGGGIRGIAYVGALQALEERGALSTITHVGGTSAGAINALLLAVGYTTSEMDSILFSTNFGQFNQGQYLFFGGATRMAKRYGWYRSERFRNWIAELIEAKAGKGQLTFQELYELSEQDSSFRKLRVVATDLSAQKPIIFSTERYPDLPICEAVRMSMSVPLYFEAVFLEPDGRVVNAKKASNEAHIIIDGGVVTNFPIHLFDTSPENPNPSTLGLRLDTDAQIQQDQTDRSLAPAHITNIKEYGAAFYTMILEELNRNQLTDADWDRTVSISTKGIGPKVKRLSVEQKNLLVNSGREGVERFFKNEGKNPE